MARTFLTACNAPNSGAILGMDAAGDSAVIVFSLVKFSRD
jgi:hypothetical protein